jgi:hypothetical protein
VFRLSRLARPLWCWRRRFPPRMRRLSPVIISMPLTISMPLSRVSLTHVSRTAGTGMCDTRTPAIATTFGETDTATLTAMAIIPARSLGLE